MNVSEPPWSSASSTEERITNFVWRFLLVSLLLSMYLPQLPAGPGVDAHDGPDDATGAGGVCVKYTRQEEERRQFSDTVLCYHMYCYCTVLYGTRMLYDT